MAQRFILTEHAGGESARRALRRDWEAGDVDRVRPGVFLSADEWELLDERWRHIARVCAAVRAIRVPVAVSHGSAGALWGFPVLDGYPDRVHVIDPRRTTTKRNGVVVRHAVSLRAEAARRLGLACTSALQTAVDIALGGGYLAGLLAFDSGIRRALFTADDLGRALDDLANHRGIRGARSAAELAGPYSGSPAESIAKGVLVELGYPLPTQQKHFPRPGGGDYYVDFWWEEHGIIGEFDGHEKYRSEALRRGLTIEEVILREKERSDDLLARSDVRGIVRWNYATLRHPTRLRALLDSSGLPRLARHPAADRSRPR